MKWKTLSTENLFKSGLVTIDKEKCEMPDGRIMPGYFIMRFPDWVNIVPVTKDGRVVLIKQYRHATREIHWEVPGGAVNRGEDAQLGALRELEEETGYTSAELVKVGENYPNPALQDNTIHTYVALNCEYQGAQNLDPYEEIEVELVPLAELRSWVRDGKFNHIIVLASVYQALDFLERDAK
jgi:8-oxo-dGTP pyrophosphatase MutT (NUDIX family)